ncbi:MAG: PcfJ domain-containing protein [Alphaproteobacteria bacterium]|nr:PcfJ domain-containing protein [Alphaproteobacteria bacterium]
MPSRNRKKVAAETRARAEAQQAARRQQRLARAEQEERTRAALARSKRQARAQAVAVVSRFAQAWGSTRSLLALARVQSDVRQRVEKLLKLLDAQAPALCTVDQLPWLLLLAGERWVRPLDGFVSTGGSVAQVRDAIAAYLLTRYPVPPFLLRALDVAPLAVARVPEEDRWAVGALSAVGRGQSLGDLAGTSALAAPLTRRMCHLFLRAGPAWTPIRALRHAQVVGFGGRPGLVDLLLQTRLGTYRGDHPWVGEPFWHRVIEWACTRPWIMDLDPEGLGDVLAWLESEQWEACARGEELSLTGRTEASVGRSVAAWRALVDAQGRGRLPASGIPAWSEDAWTIVALDTPAALVEEGTRMRHCVGMYERLAAMGKVALFSLRKAGAPRLTIEVVLATRHVVQAKGACNRAPNPDELDALRRWAAASLLAVDRRVA